MILIFIFLTICMDSEVPSAPEPQYKSRGIGRYVWPFVLVGAVVVGG